MRPADATSSRRVRHLRADHITTRNGYYLLHAGNRVVLGLACTGKPLHMSRRDFQRFVDWWLRDQPELAPSAKRAPRKRPTR